MYCHVTVAYGQDSGVSVSCGWLNSFSLTPSSFSSFSVWNSPYFTLQSHWPKQLYSLINERNTYTEGPPTPGYAGFWRKVGDFRTSD